MDRFETDVIFNVANDLLKRDAAQSKQEISGIGDTAEKVADRVEESVAEAMREQEKQITASSSSLRKQMNVLNSVSDAYKEMLEDAIQVYGELSPRTQRYHQQLSQFDRESRDLAAAQNQLSTAFQKGDITQRQYTDASRALAIQQTRVEQKISEINGELQRNNAIESAAIGSIAQKTAKLTQLRAQYDRLSEAQRTNAQVGGRIREEYQRLTKEVDQLNASLGGTKSQGIGKVFSSIQGIAGTLGIAFSVQQLVSFGKELFEIAKQAEGVELAFARMGDTKALDRLREATKNTVSDLELMKLAVRADNFRIPMEVLAKGLEFAKRRATDTGQEVDYMVNSFVDGLGRKSSLVLDNLGISLIEIQEEVKKVGDFNIAVGNIITREMAKAGESVDTLADKSGRLATIWENLKKELSRAFGRELDADNIQRRTEFLQVPRLRLFDGATKEERDDIINDLREMKRQADEALKSKTEEYNSANAFLVDINAIEKQYGKSIKNIRSDLQAQKQAAMEESQAINNALNNLMKKNEEMAVQERQGKGIFSIEELRQKIADLTSARDKLTDPQKVAAMNKEIDGYTERLQKLSGSERKKEASAADKALDTETKARKRLLDQWVAMDADYLAKAMTKDEQEVQSVRNKYADFRKAAEEFNAKAKGQKISLDGLDESEQAAIDAIRYRQQTSHLTTELQKQRELWEQYEEFKTATSKEQADERYANELEKIRSFRADLEKQVSDLGMKKITTGLTGGEEERLKALDTLLRGIEDKEQSDRDARFKKAFADYTSYEQKRAKIVADAEKDISALTEKGELDRADERRKARDRDLLELGKAEVEGSEAYKNMTSTLNTAGSAMAVQALKHGKEAVISLIKGMKGRTEAEKAALIKMFEEWFGKAIAEATDENFSNVTSLVGGFDQLLESALQFDGTMSTSLKTIGSMVSQVGKLSDTLGKTLQGLGGSLSKGGGYASIIGGLISAFGTIVSISEARSEKQLQKIEEANELQIKGLNATTKLLERQLSIVEDIYGTKRIEAYRRAVVDTEKTINDGLSDIGDSTFALFTGSGLTRAGVSRFNNEFNGSLDELDKAIAEAEKKSKNFWNIIWGSSSTYSREADALRSIRDSVLNGDTWQAGWNTVADITQEGINKLYEIIDSGTLDDVTAAKVQNIIDQYELWREATNALNEELTGTTFGAITDEIVQMFRTGTVAAEDFAESFEKLMQEALLNSFKRKYLEEGLQEWYDDFADAVESDNPDGTEGLDDDEIAALRARYNEIIENAKRGFESLEDIAKMPLTDPTSPGSSSGISGRINRTIEESTASEILGFERARYDLAKRDLAVSEESMAIEKQLYDATLQSLRHQAAIEQNTADTVTELRSAVVELKAINKNTKQTSTGYDRP